MDELSYARRLSLLKNAVEVRDEGQSVNELCEDMVEVAKKGTPAKAEWNGKTFVIEPEMPIKLALQAWKEQAYMPHIQGKIDSGSIKPEALIEMLEMGAEYTKVENSSMSFMEAAATELLVSNFPEHRDKPTMLQLMNAEFRVGLRSEKKERVSILEELMDARLKEYISGKDNFPITLENVVTLQKITDTYSAQKLENKDELKERIYETELKMLENLKPKDLYDVSDELLHKGINIAEKHQKEGDFESLFVNELMLNRLARGRTFDPRSN